MHMEWDTALSALASGGVVAAFARAFLGRAFKDLEESVKEITKLNERLAVLAVKLETMERTSNMLFEHDRKIAAIEQVIYGGDWQASSFPASDSASGKTTRRQS